MDEDLLATPKRSRDALEDAGRTPSKAIKRRKLNYGKHSVIIIIIIIYLIFFYSILHKLFIAKYMNIYIFLIAYFQIQTKALWKITLRRMKVYL